MHGGKAGRKPTHGRYTKAAIKERREVRTSCSATLRRGRRQFAGRHDGTAHDEIVNQHLCFLEGFGANVLDAVRRRLVHVHDHSVAELVG
jgi:hypothetical protein